MIEDIRKALTDADFNLEPDDEKSNEIIVNLVHIRIVLSIDTYYGYYFYYIASSDSMKQFTDPINICAFDLVKNVLEICTDLCKMENWIIENTLSDLLKHRDKMLNGEYHG